MTIAATHSAILDRDDGGGLRRGAAMFIVPFHPSFPRGTEATVSGGKGRGKTRACLLGLDALTGLATDSDL